MTRRIIIITASEGYNRLRLTHFDSSVYLYKLSKAISGLGLGWYWKSLNSPLLRAPPCSAATNDYKEFKRAGGF